MNYCITNLLLPILLCHPSTFFNISIFYFHWLPMISKEHNLMFNRFTNTETENSNWHWFRKQERYWRKNCPTIDSWVTRIFRSCTRASPESNRFMEITFSNTLVQHLCACAHKSALCCKCVLGWMESFSEAKYADLIDYCFDSRWVTDIYSSFAGWKIALCLKPCFFKVNIKWLSQGNAVSNAMQRKVILPVKTFDFNWFVASWTSWEYGRFDALSSKTFPI